MIDATSLVDTVIAITVCECVVIAACGRRASAGISLRDVGLNIASGLCLMLALRCFAANTGLASVAACLAAAGIAHVADLFVRWRRGHAQDRSATGVLA